MKKPIAVMDSGVGGLTVAVVLQKMYPNEDIVYFGDSGNCPYGNRTPENIVELTVKMCSFLESKGAKMHVFACNTISTLIKDIAPKVNKPCVGVVEPASKAVAKKKISPVGVIATEQTIKSKAYQDIIIKNNPEAVVAAKGSPNLAALIDCGEFDYKAIDKEITDEVPLILDQAKVKAIILGCTHYPIVKDRFEKLYPDIEFIDPAVDEVNEMAKMLKDANQLETSKEKGNITIYTSGDKKVYEKMCKILGVEYKEIVEVKL